MKSNLLNRASKEFRQALALISSSKSWRKWQKPVSKSAYEKICQDAREGVLAFGLTDEQADKFIENYIDFYLGNGYIDPAQSLNPFYLGIFATLRRQIDESIARRYKAMLRASQRKNNSENTQTTISQYLTPDRKTKKSQKIKKPYTPPKQQPRSPKTEKHPKLKGIKIRRPAPSSNPRRFTPEPTK